MEKTIEDLLKNDPERIIETYFAEKLFNYRPVRIGADYDGKNAGEILAPFGEIPKDYQLPRAGAIPRSWLVPNYLKNESSIADIEWKICFEGLFDVYCVKLNSISQLPPQYNRLDAEQAIVLKFIRSTLKKRGQAAYLTLLENEDVWLKSPDKIDSGRD